MNGGLTRFQFEFKCLYLKFFHLDNGFFFSFLQSTVTSVDGLATTSGTTAVETNAPTAATDVVVTSAPTDGNNAVNADAQVQPQLQTPQRIGLISRQHSALLRIRRNGCI